jgi:hypothetical protein
MIRGYFGILLAGLLRISESLPELIKGLELATEVEGS